MPKKKSRIHFSPSVKKLKQANAYLNEIRRFRQSLNKPDAYFGLKTLIALLSAGLYGYTTYNTALSAVATIYHLPKEAMNTVVLAIYADTGGMIFSAKNSTQFWPVISKAVTNTFHRVKTDELTPEDLLEKGRKLVAQDQTLTSKIFAIALPFVIAALSAGCALQSENGANLSMVILFALVGINTNTLGTAKLPQTISEALSVFRNKTLSHFEKLTQEKLHSLSDEELENLLNSFKLLRKGDLHDEDTQVIPSEEDKIMLRRVIAAELGITLDERDQPKIKTTDGNTICLDEEGQPIKVNSKDEPLTELPSDQEIIDFAGVLQQFDNITEVFQKINLMIQQLKMTPDELIRAFKPESKGWRGFKAGLTIFSILVGATSVTSNAFTMGLLQEITGKFFRSWVGETVGGMLGKIFGTTLSMCSAGVYFLVHIPAFVLSAKAIGDFIQHPLNSLKSLLQSPANLVALTMGGAVAYGAWMMHFFTTEENNPIKNPVGATTINISSAASFALNAGVATFYLVKTTSTLLWNGIKKCCQKSPKTIREEASEICEEVMSDALAVQKGLSPSSMEIILKGLASTSGLTASTEEAFLLEESHVVSYASSETTSIISTVAAPKESSLSFKGALKR